MFKSTVTDNPITKIELHFLDGSKQTLEHGFAGQLDKGKLSIQFTGMSDAELTAYLLAISHFGVNLIQAVEHERKKEEHNGESTKSESHSTT